MAERKSAFDNIREDFSFLLDPSSYDLPDWLQFGIGDNEYVPEATPPTPMTPEQRRRAEQEARRAQILAADAGLGSPPAMTMAPEMGVAPLDGVSGMGLTGGDMPVQVAPYGVTPELGGPQGADDIEAAIAGLQSADRTRGGTAIPSPGEPGFIQVGDPNNPRNTGELNGIATDNSVGDFWTPAIDNDSRDAFVDAYAKGTTYPDDPYASPAYPEMGMDTGVGLTEAIMPPSNLKKDPPAEVGGGTGGSGKPAGAGTAAVPVDETPVKENPLNALQQFTQDKFGWDEDKRGDMSEALMSAGFAMMAGDSPDWAQNVGKGGLVGIEAYQGAKDQRRSEGLEEDALAMQKELHALRLAEGSRAAEKHEMAKAKASQLAAMGPELDPRSPAGKLYMDAMELAERSNEPVEVVMERLIELGIYKDPREAGFEE